jgi:RNA ligase
VAHNTLHRFADGWTQPLRLCRGIVFNRRGTVVAFPFPKFFNYGERPETRELPDQPFVATAKEDGHLGIIFEHRGEILVTTRGDFQSRSSGLANQMLKPYRRNWKKVFPKDVTLLAEIIHPETEVHVDYGGHVGFVVIGAFHRRTFKDFDYEELSELAARLDLPVTQRWSGRSIEELRELMKDLSIENKEGFVARFAGGLRVKFKFKSYIARMIGEKLTHRYVIKHLMEDTFERKLADLPAEVQMEAEKLAQELLGVVRVEGDKKARWQYLYELVPAEECTDYHKTLCRAFLAWLRRSGKLPPEKAIA